MLNRKVLVAALAGSCLALPAGAQTPGAQIAGAEESEAIIVTGSRIRRNVQDSPLPLQIFAVEDLRREQINSPEQFIALLTSNGNGLDNLASNADVVSGQARGNNGASSANLRNQGSNATLILLNGRRVPAHGLNGGVVDINQIPLFAVERIEVLKDGASAIYGTDAVGGVINFITRQNFSGFNAQGFMDLTEGGGGNIFRGSVIGGYGDLDSQGFNVMAGVSISDHRELRGDQRDFVNTFQPNRGLSPDTRGTPHGTIFPLGVGPNTPTGTIMNNNAAAPFLPGSTTVQASGGFNVLDFPGGPGCESIDGQGPYDAALWAAPTAALACAWDTGRAAVLQQPLRTISYIGRASFRTGDHNFFAELTGSEADSAKRFSNIQLIPNTTFNNYAYRRTAANAATYDRIFNTIVATFPTLEARRGQPIAFRWRCIECGRREIDTTTRTIRFAAGADGPLAGGWDYRAGVSYGSSTASSTLGGGYYFRGTANNGAIIGPGLISAMNSGVVNPFLLPGETQSPEALALLEQGSARGVVLYGGRFDLWQLDFSTSGPLFDVWGGTVQAAVGVDYRIEDYSFNGDQRAVTDRPVIIGAPFDDANALAGASRNVAAVYGEVLIPLFRGFELTGALRHDRYTGFGGTTNPKIAAKYRPIRQLMFRGSYNTSYRVPTFNQLFNGVIESQFLGGDIADPGTCPGGVVNPAVPGCSIVRPNLLNGGRRDLGPETAEQFSAGVVFEPTSQIFLSVDWWKITRENTTRVLGLQDLIRNYDLFEDKFIRDASGTLIAIDQRWLNTGGFRTEGIEVSARGSGDLWNGNWVFGLDGTYLISRRTRFLATSPYGPSEVGQFSFSGDLNLRWRHNIFFTYNNGPWTASISQNFRKGYQNQELPGVRNGTVNPPDVVRFTRDYVTYNLSAGYTWREKVTLTAGVKNLFDRDPPFAISYDSATGAGSSWEPRVADPRGRSFTLLLDVKL